MDFIHWVPDRIIAYIGMIQSFVRIDIWLCISSVYVYAKIYIFFVSILIGYTSYFNKDM